MKRDIVITVLLAIIGLILFGDKLTTGSLQNDAIILLSISLVLSWVWIIKKLIYLDWIQTDKDFRREEIWRLRHEQEELIRSNERLKNKLKKLKKHDRSRED